MRKLIILVAMMTACSSQPPPLPPPTCGVGEHLADDNICVCDEGLVRTGERECTTPFPRLNTKFKWYLARGFSLFAGARAREDQIRVLYDRFRTKWPNLRLTPRVCGELRDWPFISEEETPDEPRWLPRGVEARPFTRQAPAYLQLKEFLDVAVTIPDAQVLVVPICNLKEDGTKPEKRLKWVRNVCHLAGTYPNTAIEIANEYIHPNSSITVQEMKRLIIACRVEAPNTQIGTDTNINKMRRAYDPDLAPLVDFFSYHPWRNPDPTKPELREIVRDRIGATVFSETTAFANPKWGRLGGCCTSNKEQIMDYARHVEKSGGVFFFHTVWGLGWPTIPIGWIMPHGDWPIRHGK